MWWFFFRFQLREGWMVLTVLKKKWNRSLMTHVPTTSPWVYWWPDCASDGTSAGNVLGISWKCKSKLQTLAPPWTLTDCTSSLSLVMWRMMTAEFQSDLHILYTPQNRLPGVGKPNSLKNLWMTTCFYLVFRIMEVGDQFFWLVFSHHHPNFPSAIISKWVPPHWKHDPPPAQHHNIVIVIKWSLIYLPIHKASHNYPKPSWLQLTYTLQKLKNPNKTSCDYSAPKKQVCNQSNGYCMSI